MFVVTLYGPRLRPRRVRYPDQVQMQNDLLRLACEGARQGYTEWQVRHVYAGVRHA